MPTPRRSPLRGNPPRASGGAGGALLDDGGRLHASYQTRQFTVPAGASVFADVHVRLVALLTLTGADTCLIRLNDGPLGLAFESWQFRTPGDPHGIRRLELVNPAAAPITVVLALARSGELIDGRFALPAALQVEIAAAGLPLPVELAAAGLPLPVELATQRSLDFTDSDGFNTNTGPIGASWYRYQQGNGAGAAVRTAFLPAANTAGAILRSLMCAAESNAAAMIVDTAAPTSLTDIDERALFEVSTGNTLGLAHPVYVPAGNGLYAAHGPDRFRLAITWDFL